MLDIAKRESAAFVYDAQTLDAAIAAVLGVRSVRRWAYAMKANWHPEILRKVYGAGLIMLNVAGLNTEAAEAARELALEAERKAARDARYAARKARQR